MASASERDWKARIPPNQQTGDPKATMRYSAQPSERPFMHAPACGSRWLPQLRKGCSTKKTLTCGDRTARSNQRFPTIKGMLCRGIFFLYRVRRLARRRRRKLAHSRGNLPEIPRLCGPAWGQAAERAQIRLIRAAIRSIAAVEPRCGDRGEPEYAGADRYQRNDELRGVSAPQAPKMQASKVHKRGCRRCFALVPRTGTQNRRLLS